MKKKFLIPLFIIGLFTACTSDDDGESDNNTVHSKITFIPNNNGMPYSIEDTVNNSEGFATRFDEFKFYISNVKLFKTNGDSLYVDSVQLIDFTNEGSETFEIETSAGIYDKIKFSVGLSEDLNQTDPVKRPSDHPLSQTSGMFWTWGSQYRFITLQGFYSILPSTNLSETFAWHPGKEPLYREVELNLNDKQINNGSEIKIDLNVNTLLTKIEVVDIPNEPNWHGSPTNIATAHKIVNNFVASLSTKN